MTSRLRESAFPPSLLHGLWPFRWARQWPLPAPAVRDYVLAVGTIIESVHGAERARVAGREGPPADRLVVDAGVDATGEIATGKSRVSLGDLIARWIPGRLVPLGTDGFGRSETRAALRNFFEVDARHVTLAALWALAQENLVDPSVPERAIVDLDSRNGTLLNDMPVDTPLIVGHGDVIGSTLAALLSGRALPLSEYQSPLEWYGLLVPTGTPKEIVDRLHRETVRAIANPKVMQVLTNLGTQPVSNTPDEFRAFLQDQRGCAMPAGKAPSRLPGRAARRW